MYANDYWGLKNECGDRCQFVNQDLADHRAGDGEADPCCKNCQVPDCQYRCIRVADILREEIGEHKSEEEQEEPEQEITGNYKGIEFVRRILQANQKLLKDYLDVGGLPVETVERQKVITGALAAMVCDLEQQESKPVQPELPVLKNNDQRKEWLARYKDWGLWYRDEHIDVKYYKYDFPDGSRLVVSEYPKRISFWTGKEGADEYYFHLLEKNRKWDKGTYDESYRHSPDSETYLVEFLKNLQRSEKEK